MLRGFFGNSPQGVTTLNSSDPLSDVIFSGKHFLRRTKSPTPATGHGMKYETLVENTSPIPESMAKDQYQHMGDVDAHFDTLYVPIERQGSYTQPAIACFDPSTLSYTSHTVTSQHHAPWVAVHPLSRTLFSSEFNNVTSLYSYTISPASPTHLSFSRSVPLTNLPPPYAPLGLQDVQGGVVLPSLDILVLTSSAPAQPIFLFDISRVAAGGEASFMAAQNTNVGGEPEGISFLNHHLIAVLHTPSLFTNEILQYAIVTQR